MLEQNIIFKFFQLKYIKPNRYQKGTWPAFTVHKARTDGSCVRFLGTVTV